MNSLDLALTELLLENSAVDTVQLNARLELLDWSSGAERYAESPLAAGRPGGECFPELIGLEPELEQIRLHKTNKLYLAKLNREAGGDLIYYSLTIVAYQSPNQPEEGLVCIIKDVTETARLEQNLTQQRNELSILRYRLEEQNANLLELNQLKSAFLGIAAHELRSPLTSIGGFVDLILGSVFGPLNDMQQQYLTKVSNNVKRLTTLTNDLLDLERIESGTMVLDLSSFNFISLVQSVASNFQVDLQRRELALTISDEPKKVLIQADVSRLEQVLTNLISNAIKYSPDETAINISFEQKTDQIITHISDSGIGISLEDQQRLFQRFFRASNANSKGARGSGLGLSIVRAILERHGGWIKVESVINQGSTFSFGLPTNLTINS